MSYRIPTKYRESGHLSSIAIERLEEGMEVGGEYTFRMVKGTVKVVEKGWELERGSHEYYYRSYYMEISESDCYNPWKVGMGTRAPTFETLDLAKAFIDKMIAASTSSV